MIETSTYFGRTLLLGIAQYIRENGPWSLFFTDRGGNDPIPSWLDSWTGHGIISRLPSPDIREIVARKRIPVVDLNEQMGDMGVPLISTIMQLSAAWRLSIFSAAD
jgi:LacI family transcriptional regulator